MMLMQQMIFFFMLFPVFQSELTINKVRSVKADSVRAKDQDQHRQKAEAGAQQYGTLHKAIAQGLLLSKEADKTNKQNATEQNAVVPRGQAKGEKSSREQLAPVPLGKHASPQAEGQGNVSVTVQGTDQAHEKEGSAALEQMPCVVILQPWKYLVKFVIQGLKLLGYQDHKTVE